MHSLKESLDEQAQFIKRPNEELYATYFSKVFEDKQNKYNSMTIYKVPDKAPANLTAPRLRVSTECERPPIR